MANEHDDLNAKGTSDAAQAGSGAGSHTEQSHQGAFEGSIKQASDVGFEEATSFMNLVNELNAKRTYDQSQSFDLSQLVGDSTNRINVNNIAQQALQNAVETANMIGKQAVRHSDIAIDRQWNVDEQGYTVNEILRSETFKDGIAAAVTAAVANALNKE